MYTKWDSHFLNKTISLNTLTTPPWLTRKKKNRKTTKTSSDLLITTTIHREFTLTPKPHGIYYFEGITGEIKQKRKNTAHTQ